LNRPRSLSVNIPGILAEAVGAGAAEKEIAVKEG